MQFASAVVHGCSVGLSDTPSDILPDASHSDRSHSTGVGNLITVLCAILEFAGVIGRQDIPNFDWRSPLCSN